MKEDNTEQPSPETALEWTETVILAFFLFEEKKTKRKAKPEGASEGRIA